MIEPPCYPNTNVFINKLGICRHKKLQQAEADITTIQFIERLSYYYDLINRLHPFSEGNGRTQRLFIQQLAIIAATILTGLKFTPGRSNKPP